MQNLKVKNIIIGYQYEETENFKSFINIAKKKNINIILVQSGDTIKIDSNTYFEILFPIKNNMISENSINNNSIVAKLVYKEISILFTGDIEEKAEKELLKYYNNFLNCDILKVAHHGSNSSTTEDFLEKVSPKIALIGVGENNLYKHPNNEVISRLQSMRDRNF